MASETQDRQIAELTLLSAMFPDEFSWYYPPEGMIDSLPHSDSDFEVKVTLNASYILNIALPPDYPAHSKPRISLSCGGDIDRATQKAARSQLNTVVERVEPGVECLDIIVNEFIDILSTQSNPDLEADRESNSKASADNSTNHIKRAVIWSHHLLATSKRRSIINWSKELHLGGYSRPGYPGAIFVEGEEDYVDEFIRRLKELRWQALQVRASQTCKRRVCSSEDGIVETEGLGQIAEALKARGDGSADMFLEGMKIGTSS